MKNEDKLRLAKKKQQEKDDIVSLLISLNAKFEKIIDIHKSERVITVRGMSEVKQTLKNIQKDLVDKSS